MFRVQKGSLLHTMFGLKPCISVTLISEAVNIKFRYQIATVVLHTHSTKVDSLETVLLHSLYSGTRVTGFEKYYDRRIKRHVTGSTNVLMG